MSSNAIFGNSVSSSGAVSLTATTTSSNSNGSNSSNMYRVGDYVYFENSSTTQYAIRRIDELNKTATGGGVEAKVMCFYRRSELPPSVLSQADKHHWGESMVSGQNASGGRPGGGGSSEPDSDDDEVVETPQMIKEKAERAAFKLREVFLSRQMETLPATLIRGKCSVTLLSEVETTASYTGRDDTFFYALVYDPHQKSLVADRGEIRIGSNYQATITPLLKEGVEDGRDSKDLEEFIWNPDNVIVESGDVEKYLIIARSVGTFARALDCSSSVKQPSLHISASAASRDVTLFYAYDLLHKQKYQLADAIKALVPTSGPMLCRDEMEDWSSSEANLFEEALDKNGKEFENIRKDYLPWKSMRNIIEYFFMWKTTDRYVQHKRLKALENESKLKQVYVPNYTNKNTRLAGSNGEIIIRGKDCDAYPNLAKYSWTQFKQYGKFVPATNTEDAFILDKSSFLPNTTAARLAQLRPGLIIEPDTPVGTEGGKTASGKTRAALYLRTTPVTRAARRVCTHMITMRHASRTPGKPLDMKAIKAHVKSKLPSMSEKEIRQLNSFTEPKRADMSSICKKLGQTDLEEQEWLVLTPKDKLPQPVKEAWPRPAKRPDGSYIYDRIPSVGGVVGLSHSASSHHPQMLYKKRAYEDTTVHQSGSSTGHASGAAGAGAGGGSGGGGGGGGAAKIQRTERNIVPPKGRVATLTRIHGMQKQVGSWMDAPDDVYFKATAGAKKNRKRMSRIVLRRAARKPFKKVLELPPAYPPA
jgi:metastasis-associated protein MTA